MLFSLFYCIIKGVSDLPDPQAGRWIQGGLCVDISLRELFRDSVFDRAEILAGKSGLSRRCQRVSVFDCPYHEALLAQGIIKPGDLFLSVLEQFQDGRGDLMGFARGLVSYRSAGLLILPTGAAEVLTRQVLDYFDQNDFPVIGLKANISYGDIMAAINSRLRSGDRNEINLSRLNRILRGGIGESEKRQLLLSINPEFTGLIRSIYVKGEFRSPWFSARLSEDYAYLQGSSILFGEKTIILLSGTDQKQLKTNSNMIASQLGRYFEDYHIGFSRIHPLGEIAEVLREGELTVKVSTALQVLQQAYDPLLSQQLMFSLQDSTEAQDFYQAYVETIAGGLSENMLQEYLRTVELFVAHKGNYAQLAQELNQHINTVRYRINRVRQILNMEDDTIRFYETISIATKLGICFEAENLNFLQKGE